MSETLKISSHLRNSRIAVTVVFFINGMAFALFYANVAFIKTSLDLSDGALGTALGVMGVGTVIFAVVSSAIVTKVGTRPTMLIGAVTFALVLLYVGTGVTKGTIIVALLLLGGTSSLIDVAMNTHGTLVEREYSTEIMSSIHAAYSFGGFVGSVVAAAIVTITGSVSASFVFAGVTMTLTVLIAWVPMRSLQPERTGEDRKWNSKGVLNKALIILVIFMILALFVENGVNGWSSVYLDQVVRADAALVPMAFGVFQLAMGIGRFLAGPIIRATSVRTFVLFGCILAAAGVVLAVVFPSSTVAIIGFGMVGLGYANLTPLIFSRAAAAVPWAPAVGIAIVSTLGYLGFIAGPFVLGHVSDLLGLRIAFLMIGIALVIIGIGAKSLAQVRPSAQLSADEGSSPMSTNG